MAETEKNGLPSRETFMDLLDRRFPFLQLVTTDNNSSSDMQLNFVEVSPYKIHDYGPALSVSLFNLYRYSTITDLVLAVHKLSELIVQKGWFTVRLVDGTETMQTLLWINSQKMDFDIENYTPSAKEKNVCEYLHRLADAQGVPFKITRPRPQETRTGASSS